MIWVIESGTAPVDWNWAVSVATVVSNACMSDLIQVISVTMLEMWEAIWLVPDCFIHGSVVNKDLMVKISTA